jgi:uncharacterized protein
MTRFTWSEAKCRENIRKHGIDFADIPAVFSGFTLTYEDRRFSYEDQRFITIGLLRETVVLIAHSESAKAIRIIHARKASKATAKRYFERFSD